MNQVKRKEFYIMNPVGFFKKTWDFLMLAALSYTATYSPFRVAFYTEASKTLLIIETTIDILFILDLIMMFFTPYERGDGSYESRPKKIATNYLFGGFIVDAIASTPTQVFEVNHLPG